MLHRITLALGLFIALASPVSAQSTVTFNNQVVRIFQQHCQTCHRPGNIAPFSLLTYQDAVTRARLIGDAVESKEMPPWKAVGAHGVFQDERTLSDQEIETIRNWVSSGAPEGRPEDVPPAATFPETWALGRPDTVVQSTEPYQLQPNSGDVYRCFPMQVNPQSDVYVRGYEVLPGNRKIVHHVLLFLDETGLSVNLDNNDPGPGYTCFGGAGFLLGLGGLGGWVPGSSAQMFPLGTGVRIPAGTRIVMQVHYSPVEATDGAPLDPDLTRIGLYLSPASLAPVSYLPVVNPFFRIPAGEAHYQVRATSIIPNDVDLVGIAPHMHLLGRQATVTARFPNGDRRELVRIDDWDFHWQGIYMFSNPVPLPAGTLIEMVAFYDNSTNNLNNPTSPPVAVSWGERTIDEMCLTFLMVKDPGIPAISTVPFSLSDRSATSVVTQDSPATAPRVGYAKISGGTASAPAGLAIFGYRQNGVLISETGVSASGLLTRARMYAETGAGVRSGVAIANPGSEPSTISFSFNDANGQEVRSGTASIAAGGQTAGFLDEFPFNGAASFSGSFTLTSSRPVSVVALRGYLNERSEFLLTTIPVTDLSAPLNTSIVFPHFADGGGWSSQIVLVNPTENTISGVVQFTDSRGQPSAGGSAYTLLPRATRQFLLNGSSTTVRTGSIWVIPTSNNPAPSGSLVFSYQNSNVRVTEAGVAGSAPGSSFRLYAEASDSIHSGLAITNTSGNAATIRLELVNLNGSSVGGANLTLAGNAQLASFLEQIPGLDMVSLPFQGLLRVSSSAPIAVAGLRGRYNERGDFLITTTPPVSENGLAVSGDAYFAHFADSGGYTTQFVLFSKGPGNEISGDVRFMSQDGKPLDLKLR